jgi:hypothetical protein
MTAEKIFVGRKAELEQFKKVFKDPRGRAVLLVGQACVSLAKTPYWRILISIVREWDKSGETNHG